jgi:hypothetical protein
MYNGGSLLCPAELICLDFNGWTQSESSVLQSSSHDDSVSSIVAHDEPRLAPLGRPTLMGPIGNLVMC